MKGNIKGVILIVVAIAAGIGGYFLLSTEYKGYSIICFALALILLIFGIKVSIDNRNPVKAYENRIKSILNTFDSILVKSSSLPKLVGRNIIIVDSIDDMVDAQLEIRKPICYYKQSESGSFVLLDDKEAYIYVEKLNNKVVSPIDIEINDIKLKQRSSEDIDSEMLRDIEKTTIVKLSNKKSYKVSPIRKDKAKENKFALNEGSYNKKPKEEVEMLDMDEDKIINNNEVL